MRVNIVSSRVRLRQLLRGSVFVWRCLSRVVFVCPSASLVFIPCVVFGTFVYKVDLYNGRSQPVDSVVGVKQRVRPVKKLALLRFSRYIRGFSLEYQLVRFWVRYSSRIDNEIWRQSGLRNDRFYTSAKICLALLE